MQTKGSDRTLESFKFFPYVAWGLTVVFAIFVYSITMELKAVTDDLQIQTKHLKEQIGKPVGDIDDFGS